MGISLTNPNFCKILISVICKLLYVNLFFAPDKYSPESWASTSWIQPQRTMLCHTSVKFENVWIKRTWSRKIVVASQFISRISRNKSLYSFTLSSQFEELISFKSLCIPPSCKVTFWLNFHNWMVEILLYTKSSQLKTWTCIIVYHTP